MSKTFISYSSKDRPVARRIANDLQSRGIHVWMDEFEILPGDSIVEKIADGIRTSEYLIVLISKNSVGSSWVRKEFELAFERNRDASERRLIPVRVDDTPVPPYLAGVQYVDLRPDYSAAIDRLANTLIERPVPEAPAISTLIDPDELASHIQQEQGKFRGAGYRVTSLLGFLTLVVTIIAAIPSFQQGFGNQPKVYYSVAVERLGLPPSMEADRIRKLLKINSIPDATVRVGIVNKGDAAAKIIKAGVRVSGAIDYAESEPPPHPEPVWVKILIDHNANKSPSYVRYEFQDLVADHPLEAKIGFYSDSSQTAPSIDIVVDGKIAQKVSSLELAPDWSIWQLFELPLKILGWGFAITLMIGLMVVVAANPRTRGAFLLLVKELNPTVARLVDIIIRTMH